MAACKFLIHVSRSLYELVKFFINKKNCRLIFFQVPSNILTSYLDYDIIRTVSDRIENARIGNLDTEDKQHLIKLGWLIENFKSTPMRNPVQLIMSGEKYFCHPGTDRILVATYINPVQFINGFYLWYPELDPEPFILDYPHTEIKNIFSFLTKFRYSTSFRFRSVLMTKDLDISDKPLGHAIFSKAKECFLNTKKDFSFSFLTYRDKMHKTSIKKEDIQLKDIIYFPTSETCLFGGVGFKKINNLWITYDQHR
jgi:energy-converting hydrogenase A subunit M